MEGEGRESGRGRGGERVRGKRGERGWEGKGGREGEREKGREGGRGRERVGGRGRGRERVGGEGEGRRKVHKLVACLSCLHGDHPIRPHLNLTTLRPLGRMMSGFRFSRYSASSAVTSETVLRMCAQCAAARSRQ